MVALQLRLGLLDTDVTELKEAQSDPTAVHSGDPRGFCTLLAPSEGPSKFLIISPVDLPWTGSGQITRF